MSYPLIAFCIGCGEFRRMPDGLHWRRLDVAVTKHLAKHKSLHVVT